MKKCDVSICLTDKDICFTIKANSKREDKKKAYEKIKKNLF